MVKPKGDFAEGVFSPSQYFKPRKCCNDENALQVGLYFLIHTCLAQSSVVIVVVVVLGGGCLQCIAVSSLYIHKPRQFIPAPFP